MCTCLGLRKEVCTVHTVYVGSRCESIPRVVQAPSLLPNPQATAEQTSTSQCSHKTLQQNNSQHIRHTPLTTLQQVWHTKMACRHALMVSTAKPSGLSHALSCLTLPNSSTTTNNSAAYCMPLMPSSTALHAAQPDHCARFLP